MLPEQKRVLRAARRNIVLLRYSFLGAGAILFMLGIFGVGFAVTKYEQNQAQSELSGHEVTSAQYKEVQKRAEGFEANLKTADSILSSEILFSDLLIRVARIMPPGVILTNFNVTTESFGDEVTISARSKSYDGPLSLKSEFEKSEMFEDVSIVDITRPRSDEELTGVMLTHPFTSTLNATLTKEAVKQSTGGQR
jgi:hypothetical protein